MHPWLFNVAYLTLLALAWPWLAWKGWRQGKYRAGWYAKFWGLVPPREGSRPCVWLHAVSVGEVNLLQTLLERMEQEYPDWDMVISTTTHTGYALAKKKYAPRQVVYAPLDFSWATHAAVQRIRPTVLVLSELELWPNLLRAVKQFGTHVAVVNGRLSDKSFRGYERFATWMKPMFASLDLVAVQSEEYAERFRALGTPTERVHVSGSLKFDGAQADRAHPTTQRLAKLAGIVPENVVFLAGSTQAPEEAYAVRIFQKWRAEFPQLKLLLVPRHPERFEEVAQLLDASGVKWMRRSQLSADTQNSARVILVDVVGELGAWWGTSHIAFVGGSMGNRGGQNMIEPAAYGVATCFGPNTWNFRDVVARFLSAEAAVVVQDEAALAVFVERCLHDEHYRTSLGTRAAQLVKEQQGATALTLQLLSPLLKTQPTVPLAQVVPKAHTQWSRAKQTSTRS
jgi:3-deoxy-D-manno-octulosonic-acid transferase